MKPVFDENGLATEPGEVRCFYYDAMTLEFTGWSDEYIHTGVSMPGNSTAINPGDESPGVAYVFDGAGWQSKEDHRGTVVYSVSDGRPVAVDYIGPVRDGFTMLVPGSAFDKWNGSAWVIDTSAQQVADTVVNTARKSALISEATQIIAPLLDAKEGGYIDDADIPVLAAWQKYRYALTKVDPTKPVWPPKPE